MRVRKGQKSIIRAETGRRRKTEARHGAALQAGHLKKHTSAFACASQVLAIGAEGEGQRDTDVRADVFLDGTGSKIP